MIGRETKIFHTKHCQEAIPQQDRTHQYNARYNWKTEDNTNLERVEQFNRLILPKMLR